MTVRYIGVIDPPLVLRDDARLCDHRFVLQTPSYGRVLFTEAVAVLVESSGRGVLIMNCEFVCV